MMPDPATTAQHTRHTTMPATDATHPDLSLLADRMSDLCTMTDGIARLLQQASRPGGHDTWKPVEADTLRRWKQQIASAAVSISKVPTADLINEITDTLREAA